MTATGYGPATVPSGDARDFLHLCAIRAWHALAAGMPAPDLDPVVLETEIDAAFGGDSPVSELCERWLQTAREHGIEVDGDDGDILMNTVFPVITAAFWSGLTTGHHAITGGAHFIPRKFMPRGEGSW